MAVYPAYLSHLLPELRRVNHPFEAQENSYYIVSGFGYPNLLGHIENCVRDVNRYDAYDYLVVCFDTDDESVRDRTAIIEKVLNKRRLWPKKAKIKVICQKKCMETWFLGSGLHEKGKPHPPVLPYMQAYDVCRKDPEKMDRPENYPGSVGDFHCNYLMKLVEASGKIYTKRNPYVVCSRMFLDSLIERTDTTPHLKTFKNFLNFCQQLKEELRQ